MLVNAKDDTDKCLGFSNSIKENLSLIHQELELSLKKFPGLKPEDFNSESEIQITMHNEKKIVDECLPLLRSLFQNWDKNEMKSILLYNKLISKCKNIKYYPNKIFQNTIIHRNLWPLMTYFLQKKLLYQKSLNETSKIIDVWYQFIASEQKILFDRILLNNFLQNHNLGDWFKKQCIQNLFITYITTKNTYTNFIVDYFLYGLAFIFYESVRILKKQFENEKNSLNFYNQKEKIQRIQIIQLNFIDKFQLDRHK